MQRNLLPPSSLLPWIERQQVLLKPTALYSVITQKITIPKYVFQGIIYRLHWKLVLICRFHHLLLCFQLLYVLQW
jgi:hypothetical protein